MRPDQVKLIAKRPGVTEQDVIDMNRRPGGDAWPNAPIRQDGDSGEWINCPGEVVVVGSSNTAVGPQQHQRRTLPSTYVTSGP